MTYITGEQLGEEHDAGLHETMPIRDCYSCWQLARHAYQDAYDDIDDTPDDTPDRDEYEPGGLYFD